jgi:hypothetical protein
MQKWQCRIAKSLGSGFEGTPNKAWGTTSYKDIYKPTVFFGLYGLPDFYALWRHKGEKAILWAGSDISNFINNYWLDNKGKIKIDNKGMAEWINKYCENWVENIVEYKTLLKLGIKSKICPSFLGNINNFKPQKLNKEKRYYSSVSGNNFKLYGWDKINKIAQKNPDIKYYLYGNTKKWTAPKNVIIRGRISNKIMNNEIKTMTGAIRMTEFEGCSEIIVKSVLWGQKPISLINYPFLNSKNPRKKLLKILNKFVWNKK